MSAPKTSKFWLSSKWANANGVNASLPNAFFNDLDPRVTLQREKPVHRRIAELEMQGFTHKEIGAMLGRHKGYVSTVLRQPHTRVYMQEQVKRTVKDEMAAFLDEQLMKNLRALAEIRDTSADNKDRISAIKELNDRSLGKPTQPIRNDDKPASALTGPELEKEVNRILASNGDETATETVDSSVRLESL